jgi:hypothetical protein
MTPEVRHFITEVLRVRDLLELVPIFGQGRILVSGW